MENSSIQRVSLFVALILVLCCLGACTTANKTPAGNRLTIIGTADLQGRLDADARIVRITQTGEKIEVTGGISRIATLIKQIQQESNTPVIVVSSGDDLMGRYFHQFDGKAIYELMGMAGYEVLALGNHEFDRGPGLLAEALESVDFTALCSDLEIGDSVMEAHCQPYLLKDYQGVRVGFFSLMTEDFPVVTLTGKVKIRENQAVVAKERVKTLQQKGAQVIIAVTHIGTEMDRKLAAEVMGIDLIFGGHSHDYLEKIERVNNTLIINGGEKGPALVRLDVELDEKNRVIPPTAAYSLIPVTAEIKVDTEVEAQLAKYQEQLPAATVVGRTEKEWDLTKATLRNGESAVAELVTDVIRSQFKVDIVFFNSGSFRGNSTYSPGPVTDSMLAEIDEFESNVYLMTMQGKHIQQILEHSASLIGHGGFLQGSGIQFTIVTGAQPQQLDSNNKGEYTISKPGNMIRDIKVRSTDNRWQPLDLERSYLLASNDFLTKMAGDRYFWFKRYGSNIRNTYSTMGAVMTDYFRMKKVVNPAEPDGRIMIR